MLSFFFSFSTAAMENIWESNAPWKTALQMNDPYYLPVLPFFARVKIPQANGSFITIFADLLSYSETNSSNHKETKNASLKFKSSSILHDLNHKKNPDLSFKELEGNCTANFSQACLILGRIYEFGAYNKTEDSLKSHYYYSRARELGDSSVSSYFSFEHRHYVFDPLASVLESDISIADSFSVEAVLPTARQYQSGFMRPRSCQAATDLLVPLASMIPPLFFFPEAVTLNSSELNSLLYLDPYSHSDSFIDDQDENPQNSSDQSNQNSDTDDQIDQNSDSNDQNDEDRNDMNSKESNQKKGEKNIDDAEGMYKLAMHYLSMPYPSSHEKRSAKQLLNKSLAKGYHKAAAPLVRLRMTEKTGMPIRLAHKTLSQAKKLSDPAALLISAHLHQLETTILRNDRQIAHHARKVIVYAKKASTFSYGPALSFLGELTYLGLLGIPRSATNSHKIFMKGAALGDLNSMLAAAKQLIGGDGVTVDCEGALELLWRIIDCGPWSLLLNKYVGAGSKRAFTKMLDMNLTPNEWLEMDGVTNATQHLLKLAEIGAAVHLHSDTGLKRVRAARGGDESSIIWLALESPLTEVDQWLEKLDLLPPSIALMKTPVKIIVFAKGLIKWSKNQLTPEEIQVMFNLMRGLKDVGLIILTLIALIIFSIIRVYAALPPPNS